MNFLPVSGTYTKFKTLSYLMLQILIGHVDP